MISQAWPTRTFDKADSDMPASTSSVLISAMLTTAPLESAAEEKGVTMSPTLALLDKMMPSNGARICV